MLFYLFKKWAEIQREMPFAFNYYLKNARIAGRQSQLLVVLQTQGKQNEANGIALDFGIAGNYSFNGFKWVEKDVISIAVTRKWYNCAAQALFGLYSEIKNVRK